MELGEKMGAADKEFMPAEEYGRSLQGLGINLLVRDVTRSVAFAREVLGASVAFADKDFAVLRYANGPTRAEWMLHSDGTYHSNPLLGLIGDAQVRGVGAEIRLYHCDPDAAVDARQGARPSRAGGGGGQAARLARSRISWTPTGIAGCRRCTRSRASALCGGLETR